jgi:L-alanine-DL-glutamate epimerase-like enolase superfamily enzyme
VAELAGGVAGPVTVYGSSIDRQISADGLAAKIKHVHETYGVDAFKVKVAQRMGNNTDVWPNRSTEVVEAVRAAVGPGVALMADANGGWTTAELAWPMAQKLNSLNFTWFEEPVVFWEYGEDVKLVQMMKQAGFERLHVAAGEQEYRAFLLQYGYTNGLDPIQPDVGYSGGFTSVLEVARAAAAVPTHIDLHSPNPCLNLVMTMVSQPVRCCQRLCCRRLCRQRLCCQRLSFVLRSI